MAFRAVDDAVLDSAVLDPHLAVETTTRPLVQADAFVPFAVDGVEAAAGETETGLVGRAEEEVVEDG